MKRSSIGRALKVTRALLALPYYLFYCPLRAPRRTSRFLQNMNDYQDAERRYHRDRNLIRTIELTQLFPEAFSKPVRLLELGARPSGTSYFETYLLACLVQLLGARTIFEFGTSEGRTTLQLALNSPADAVIYTLDIPEKDYATRYKRAFPDEGSFRALPIGGLVEPHVESAKIKQLYADSASADYEVLRGRVNFVFIDADHGYEYVKADSENAFSMLSENGVVLWHDYGSQWRGVAQYLVELAKQGEKKLYHVAGTSLAIYVRPSCASNPGD
jgi:hypothetical protein